MPPFADPLDSTCFYLIPGGVSACPLSPARMPMDDLATPVFGRFDSTAHGCEAQTGVQCNIARSCSDLPGRWVTEDPIGSTADEFNQQLDPGNYRCS